ncbi:MAG: YafY family protein [Xanthomonadales bacterium]|nr:YafY family protein [Xanthomonadales bacterium]
MRRADRLFMLVQQLRGRRRAVTAHSLAEQLEVSERTVYRDIRDLQLSGIPIEGEAGVGYLLRKGSDLPPLMFDAEELEALVIGVRMARAFTSRRLGDAARRALVKIESVAPAESRRAAARSPVLVPDFQQHLRFRVDELHRAIEERKLLRIRYQRADEADSSREVEPVCLAFWGHAWTLGGWCRLRHGFRNFRLDRIQQLTVTQRSFEPAPERSLDAYLQLVNEP